MKHGPGESAAESKSETSLQTNNEKNIPSYWNIFMIFPPKVRWAFNLFSAQRRSGMRATVFAAIAAFFTAWGGFYYNNRNAPPWIAVGLFCFGGIWLALCAGQVAINFRKTDRVANICFVTVLAACFALTALDLYFEYRPRPHDPPQRETYDAVTKGFADLKKKTLPRHIDEGQFVRLVQSLRTIPKVSVEFKAVEADIEASRFKQELSSAFEQAGFPSSGVAVMGASPDAYPVGVTVVDQTSGKTNSDTVRLIKQSLASAGVLVSPVETHPDALGQRLFILIGPKPENDALAYREVVITQPNFIKGTKFTHDRLMEVFPFGYTVIFYGENKRFKYEVSNNGLLDWTLDLEKLKIEPDFTNGKVKWTLFVPTAGDGTHTNITNTQLSTTSNLEVGDLRRVHVFWANKPVPHVAVLGVDQKNPVFAVGFRIPLASERPKERAAAPRGTGQSRILHIRGWVR